MRIGYARVSTDKQSTAAQRRALKAAGCDHVFEDMAGGTKKRPRLEAAMAALGEGDVLTVYKLDRLARSMSDLIELVEAIEKKGAHLASITEAIDTTTSGGRMVFHFMGAIAQFERDLIRERTMAGLAAARDKGRVGGRRRALTPAQVDHAVKLIDQGEQASSVARSFGVARSTLYKAMSERRETI